MHLSATRETAPHSHIHTLVFTHTAHLNQHNRRNMCALVQPNDEHHKGGTDNRQPNLNLFIARRVDINTNGRIAIAWRIILWTSRARKISWRPKTALDAQLVKKLGFQDARAKAKPGWLHAVLVLIIIGLVSARDFTRAKHNTVERRTIWKLHSEECWRV